MFRAAFDNSIDILDGCLWEVLNIVIWLTERKLFGIVVKRSSQRGGPLRQVVALLAKNTSGKFVPVA